MSQLNGIDELTLLWLGVAFNNQREANISARVARDFEDAGAIMLTCDLLKAN